MQYEALHQLIEAYLHKLMQSVVVNLYFGNPEESCDDKQGSRRMLQV
jgi:hypothetical protein